MGQDGHEMNETKPQMGADKHGLLCDVREIISQARSLTCRTVNSLQVISVPDFANSVCEIWNSQITWKKLNLNGMRNSLLRKISCTKCIV